MNQESVFGLLPFLSIAIGVSGLSFALYRWRLDRKKERERSIIYEWAKKEAERQDLEPYVTRLKQQADEYEVFIGKKIPELAIQTFQQQRLTELEQQIARLYNEWEKLSKERPSAVTGIPDALGKIIEEQIMPRYLSRKRIDELKDVIILAAMGVGVIVSILPLGFLRILLWIPILLLLAHLAKQMLKTEEYRTVTNLIVSMSLWTALALGMAAAGVLTLLLVYTALDKFEVAIFLVFLIGSAISATTMVFNSMRRRGMFRLLSRRRKVDTTTLGASPT